MVPLQVLVVDDEAPARKRLTDLIEKTEDVTLLEACADGRTAIEQILRNEPDLVFLDVQMPEIDGIEVVRLVGPDRMPAVVFVTAYDQYALKAFELAAVDYLLKPFSDDRFEQAVERAREHVDTVLPGYTHLQRAQPVRLAHHWLAYQEMFARDGERMAALRRRLGRSPLGSGALAGRPRRWAFTARTAEAAPRPLPAPAGSARA